MQRSPALALSLAALFAVGGGCSTADGIATGEDDLTVDTSTPEARRQYDANVAFALGYTSRCGASPKTSRPRVFVSGFGRFDWIGDNASGRVVSALVPEAEYPAAPPPPPGQVDFPDAQLSVAASTIDVPGIGAVDVCAMILPVQWDLAAILIAKEIDTFRPAFVMMNGVAGNRQPLWIELGATNRAAPMTDATNQLAPLAEPGDYLVKIAPEALPDEDAQPNLLSWTSVQTSAQDAISLHAEDLEGDTAFGDIVQGAVFAGFPRYSNTYLCNNVTYVTGWLMGHPKTELTLLRASTPIAGSANEVRVKLRTDLSTVPHTFVHWPSDLAGAHVAAAAEVMRSIIGAQLLASKAGEPPTAGTNELADPSVGSDGPFY